jgi:hypothetical protein
LGTAEEQLPRLGTPERVGVRGKEANAEVTLRLLLSTQGQRRDCTTGGVVTMKSRMFFMLVLSLALPAAADAQVRNSGFGARGPVPPYFTQANVENFRKSGW